MKEIARERPQYSEGEYDKLLPEIAKLLNVSVSTLKSRPADMLNALCLAYVNQYPICGANTLQALQNVLNLDISQEIAAVKALENEPTKIKEEHSSLDHRNRNREQIQTQAAEEQKRKRQYILTRQQLNRNAKIIAMKAKAKSTAIEEHTENLQKEDTAGNGNAETSG